MRRHLAALDTAVQQLRRHAGAPLSGLTEDLDEVWVVERGLMLCCQNALDVATHLCAAAGRDAPDYATAIDQLGVLGALTPEFAVTFRGVAGLRNALVHGYPGVDRARLHQILNDRLDEFVLFASLVTRYLEAAVG